MSWDPLVENNEQLANELLAQWKNIDGLEVYWRDDIRYVVHYDIEKNPKTGKECTWYTNDHVYESPEINIYYTERGARFVTETFPEKSGGILTCECGDTCKL